MDTDNTTILWKNAATAEAMPSHTSVKMTLGNVPIPIFMLVSLLAGTVSNGFFLWVLRGAMKTTVNTLWFSHLILAYLLFCSFMPFSAIHILLGFHWVFGMVMCKLVNCFVSLALFATVFLLTVISLDRYALICHPVWSYHNRTIPQARRLLAGVWLVSLILSAPYLAFRETQEKGDGTIKCKNNYAVSGDWSGEETEAVRRRVHLAFTVVRCLLSFLLPFGIIVGCYYRMGREMKKRKLVRTGKPFQILAAAVTSYFVGLLPYHLFRVSLLFPDVSQKTLLILKVFTIVGGCFSFCFTPVLFLFVGEKFQVVFKTSIATLLKRGFADIPIVPPNNTDAERATTGC